MLHSSDRPDEPSMAGEPRVTRRRPECVPPAPPWKEPTSERRTDPVDPRLEVKPRTDDSVAVAAESGLPSSPTAPRRAPLSRLHFQGQHQARGAGVGSAPRSSRRRARAERAREEEAAAHGRELSSPVRRAARAADSLQLTHGRRRRPQLFLRPPRRRSRFAKAIERGDLTAKRRMMKSNLRLVHVHSEGYRGLGVPTWASIPHALASKPTCRG